MYCITRTSLRRLGEQWTGVSYSQVKSVFEYSDVSRRGLSSSSTTCSDRHDDPPNSQDNKNQNFRRHKYANPLQRTIGILSDDVKGFFFGVQSRFPTTGKTLDGGDPRPEPQDRLGEYTRASTVLSVGGIRQQFSVPENIQLSMYGMEFLRKAPQLLGVEGMDPPDMQDLGAKVDFMSAAQLKDKFPWLNTDGVEGGVLGLENEGWFDPWSLLFSLRRKAVSLGTQYVNGRVTGLESQILDDAILETDYRSNVKNLRKAEITLANGEKRNIHFAILVLAAGAWSGEIGRLVGIGKGDGVMAAPIPVEPRKRYVYCVHAPDGPGLNSPLVIDPNGTYFRREGLGGNYLCGQSPHEDNEPPVDDLKVDEKFFEDEVWPTIANRVPSFENLKLHTSWAGYYDYNTFDQNGIIGLHPLVSNMFIATGFSGHGIQQAAGVGRAIMECILLGEYRTINLERLGFERILLNEPLYEKNIV
ncbi:FAD-dependent oxidoreductase domain-containing protein 1-like 1 [Homarus americanus]|uniref:FAD-dependent oxidoreductase domain-containing protein 1 n=1 Tax=Homarus americanus TaxID=6706 RepID=A0A8J5MLJ8_HOMAM|nr:FAD-dependent oxidoreductase domain-containing protein 1-like 1 [Homarus americanus]